jgi:hypothetical protein
MSLVLNNLAVGLKLPRSNPHEALEVAGQMALGCEAGLIGCLGDGRALSQPSGRVKDAAMDLVLARRQAKLGAK